MTDYRQAPRRTNSNPIAAARIAAGLTQTQFATQIGVSQQVLARWEGGGRNPKICTLRKIADALGIEWTELIEEKPV